MTSVGPDHDPAQPDDSHRPTARDGEPSFWRRHAMGCGVALYAAAAVTDGYVTLEGVGVDLALEGNPLMRAMMQQFGAEMGLAMQKAMIAGATIAIAVVGERAIQRQDPWIWKVPTSRWVRSWMRRKDRSWIAFIPLYAATAGQVLAVASWVALPVLL